MSLHPLDEEHGRRFGGLDRLYGDGARLALHRGHVAVVGVGGVGCWVVEALARSGVGQITLIDFDQVAVSNTNRQIQALNSTFGMAKVHALEQRIREINPDCRVHAIEDFLTEENMQERMQPGAYDMVVDACDQAKVKAALIAQARYQKLPLLVCGAAGGKRNPLTLRQDDLGRVRQDALLARIRNMLKKDHRILPRKNGKFGVTCLYLEEPSQRSTACTTGNLSCAGYGSSVTVTATMGFAAAAWCLEKLTVRPDTAEPAE
ncbi:MAG: tRNA threonylcarbamoyladenosine dehydratase [Gallionella sp.]|nr:tRNA threonylcarbamoyladenosine dehydratase [Gallionella sp.]MDD4947108.1 tRNA threonylcarbamoyladenosine dehydratase [Gallionella sp.]MDD5611651.1 tRNA threonylcarbamoyladenosine dehydratase [Gallionella sp.]